MGDHPQCTKLYELESNECEYRFGSQCRHEGLLCAHSDGEIIFQGVKMETYLKVTTELATLKALVREMGEKLDYCADWFAPPGHGHPIADDIHSILNRPEVKVIMEKK